MSSEIKNIVDPCTGEVIHTEITTQINKKIKKTKYKDHQWFIQNQEPFLNSIDNKRSDEMRINDNYKQDFKSLYTVKGLVYTYLLNTMDYGNFCLFKGSKIAEDLNITPSAVSKAKKQLIKENFIFEAYNKRLRRDGVWINNKLVEKRGSEDENDIIIIRPDNTIIRVPEDENEIKHNIIDLESDIKELEKIGMKKDVERYKKALELHKEHLQILENAKKVGAKDNEWYENQ